MIRFGIWTLYIYNVKGYKLVDDGEMIAWCCRLQLFFS